MRLKLSQPRGSEAATSKNYGRAVTNQDAVSRNGFQICDSYTTEQTRPAGSMQFLYLIISCLILSSCVAGESEETQHDGRGATASSSHKQQKNNQGFRLISFDSVDKDLALGLNYLMPFVEVPIKRKPNAPPRVSSLKNPFYDTLKENYRYFLPQLKSSSNA